MSCCSTKQITLAFQIRIAAPYDVVGAATGQTLAGPDAELVGDLFAGASITCNNRIVDLFLGGEIEDFPHIFHLLLLFL